MVSIQTGLTLGLLGLAVVAFIGLGGASGIGARIGGGFRAFGEAVIGGIAGINPFADQGGNQPAPQESNPEPTQTPEERTRIAREAFELSGEPLIAAEIRPFAGIISTSFLESISFQPPTTGFTLDVSKTFRYLAADGITSDEAQIARLIEANSKLFPEFFG